MYSKQKCLKSKFFLFLIAFLGLFLIIGCGNGGGGRDIIPEENQSDLFPKYTGNEDFTVAAGREIDPLNGYRIDDPQNTLIPTSIDHSPYGGFSQKTRHMVTKERLKAHIWQNLFLHGHRTIRTMILGLRFQTLIIQQLQ